MASFVEVARLEQVPPGTGNSFTVAGKDVALFNVDGVIYAIEELLSAQGRFVGNWPSRRQGRHLSGAWVALRRDNREHHERTRIWSQFVPGQGR